MAKDSGGQALGSHVDGGVTKPDGDKSMETFKPMGTGSRPGSGGTKTPTSMDGVDPHTLGRDVPGWLK